MRKVSPAVVAKRIDALKEELKDLLKYEEDSYKFTCVLGEDKESVRPSYDYEATQRRIDGLTGEIRKLRHAMNVFNTNTMVPGFDMTVDEILVYLPQLRERKKSLGDMKSMPLCGRSRNRYSNVVEYTYCNYSVQKAADDYRKVAEEYAKAHTALDYINATGEIEVDW
ncbi:MAG: hypothetical protein ACI4S4_00025 [Candidatus Ornithospirochaeta sp.]